MLSGAAFPTDPFALITSRDAIVGWNGHDIACDRTYTQGALDDPSDIERWEPWVRACIAQHELLQSVHFATTASSAKLWHMTPSDTEYPAADGTVAMTLQPIVEMVRPGTCAGTTSDEARKKSQDKLNALLAKQVAKVVCWAELREERLAECAAQVVPPYAFFGSIVGLHPTRTRWTLELINLALVFSCNVYMRFKHALALRRPVECSALVQPMILTPGHGSLPSGHATEAYIVVHVLKSLLGVPEGHRVAVQLDRQAARVAVNRTVAGVHFPIDSIAGRLLGVTLGEYFVSRCTGSGPDGNDGKGDGLRPVWHPRKFDGSKLTGDEEFNPVEQALGSPAARADEGSSWCSTQEPLRAAGVGPIVREYWTKAKLEWAGVQFLAEPPAGKQP